MTRGRRTVTGLAVALIALTGVACATVGTGTRTVIKHSSSDEFLAQTYPHLIVADTSTTPVAEIAYFDDNGDANADADTRQAKMREFRAFMARKYGDPYYIPLVLQATVQDRTTVPTFSPVDYRKHLASVLLADTALSLPERRRRFTILVNQPDLHDSTTIHQYEEGIPAYRYFPRVSVDFSSSLRAASPLDRISFLLMVVQIQPSAAGNSSQLQNTAQEQIRFLNFSPKEADFVDFTRGQFTQAFQASASAAFGATTTESGGSDGATTQNSIGWTPSMTFSESYVSNLADAIERRSTGLLDGQTFYAAFRSLREVRIGGTYNFDLMLEVLSKKGEKIESGGVVSHPWEPIANEVRADVYMIGVVRHVYDRGHLRSFWGLSKVPESENDDVYEQVVVKKISDVVLWRSKELDWVASEDSAFRCVVEVFTNRPGATFVATDEGGDIVAVGGGTQGVLRVPETVEGCSTTVRFIPVVQVLSSGSTLELTVPDDEVQVRFAPEERGKVLGIYQSQSQ